MRREGGGRDASDDETREKKKGGAERAPVTVPHTHHATGVEGRGFSPLPLGLGLGVPNRDRDDARAAADDSEGAEAPLELAVGHALHVVHVLGVDVVRALKGKEKGKGVGRARCRAGRGVDRAVGGPSGLAKTEGKLSRCFIC